MCALIRSRAGASLVLRVAAIGLIAGSLSACATKPVVRTIERTVYVQAPLPAELLEPCVVHEPEGACWRDGRVLCNGQLAKLVEDYRAALAQCDAQVAGVREAQR